MVVQYREALQEFQTKYWETLLFEHDGNVSKTAKAAGVNRTALHKTLLTLGLKEPNSHMGNWGD